MPAGRTGTARARRAAGAGVERAPAWRRWTRPGPLVAAAVALSTLSLVWHATPGFDPWVWARWSRELADLRLDTTVPVAWKPLPALTMLPAAVLGGPAPELWLVVARAGGLLAVAGAGRLAWRLAGPGAGALAAGAVLLTPGIEARFARLVIQGSVEPLVVALCLWALDAGLDRREGPALALGLVAGLARPEVWPLLGLYGLWLWRRRPDLRWAVAAGLAALPVLWFGGDWVGSGSPLSGAAEARTLGPVSARLDRIVARVGRTVPVPVWLGTAAAAVPARRSGDGALRLLGAAAAGWIGVVAGMTLLWGYALMGRFLLPAAAVLCVLAGVAAARGLRALPGRAARVGALAAAGVATAVVVAPLARSAVAEAGVAVRRAGLERHLDTALARAGGPGAVTACGAVAIEINDLTLGTWPALAWRLDRPLDRVEARLGTGGGVVFVRPGGGRSRRLAGLGADSRLMARTDGWEAWALRCPAAAGRGADPDGS